MLQVLSRSLAGRRTAARRGWIGVDIGTSSVKVAQVERREGEYRLVKSLLLKNEQPGQEESTPRNLEWLRRALPVATFPDSGFAGRVAACVLSMSHAELRNLDLPPASDAELRQIIAQELESGATASTNELEFDFWRYAGDEKTQPSKGQVGVLSIADGLAGNVARLMHATGLECRILDGAPFTLARAVQMHSAPLADARPEAFLDWGHTSATLCVAAAGLPLFTRCYRECGLGSLMQAMTRHLGYDIAQCEQLLAEHGIPDINALSLHEGDVSQLIGELSAEVIDQVTDETVRTLAFLKTQSSNLQPTRLWLGGGGALIKNVGPLLAARTHLPVAAWQIPAASDAAADAAPVGLFAHAAALSILAWES